MKRNLALVYPNWEWKPLISLDYELIVRERLPIVYVLCIYPIRNGEKEAKFSRIHRMDNKGNWGRQQIASVRSIFVSRQFKSNQDFVFFASSPSTYYQLQSK